jgi:RHS repeat-associated protein
LAQTTNISSTFSEYCTRYCGFGFNGKENDNEVKGNGNSLDFGARIYDSRTGRWLSVDPLSNEYISYSPYNFTFCNPISYMDPNGKWVEKKIIRKDKDGNVKKWCQIWVKTQSKEISITVHNAKFYNDDGFVFDKQEVDGESKTIRRKPTLQELQKRADLIQKQIEDEFNTSKPIHDKKGRSVTTTVKFEGGIEAIDNLDKVVTGGNSPDDLIIASKDLVGGKGYSGYVNPYSDNLMFLEPNEAFLNQSYNQTESSDPTAPHEFLHQGRGGSHRSGGIFSPGGKLNFKNLWRFGPNFRNRGFKEDPDYKYIKEKEK